jgi:puromycin-sensitive aminopeptidase
VGRLGQDSSLAAEARARVDRFLAGDPSALEANVLPVALRIAARDGDAKLFDRYLSRMKSPKIDPILRRSLLQGLASFQSEAMSRRSRDLLFSKDLPAQEPHVYLRALTENPAVLDQLPKDLTRNWDHVTTQLKDASGVMRHFLEELGGLPGKAAFDEVKALLTAKPPKDTEEGIKQTLEHSARVAPQLSAWLKQN